MSHIFTDDGKQWYLIPELPIEQHNLHLPVEIEKAKANALPIVNPELLDFMKERIVGKLYEWPGTWQRFNWFASSSGTKVIRGAKLIAPPQPQAEKQFKNMKTGIELIAEERREQIEVHGFDVAKDRELYKDEELRRAAIWALTDLRDQLSKEQFELKSAKVVIQLRDIQIQQLEDQLSKEREKSKRLEEKVSDLELTGSLLLDNSDEEALANKLYLLQGELRKEREMRKELVNALTAIKGELKLVQGTWSAKQVLDMIDRNLKASELDKNLKK